MTQLVLNIYIYATDHTGMKHFSKTCIAFYYMFKYSTLKEKKWYHPL